MKSTDKTALITGTSSGIGSKLLKFSAKNGSIRVRHSASSAVVEARTRTNIALSNAVVSKWHGNS